MLNRNQLSKLGIGTWGIGGLMEKDTSIDAHKQIDAMAHALDKGMNFIEANYFYAQGYSVELLAKALKESGKKREDVFICQAIYLKEGKDLAEGKAEVDKLLTLFDTNYVDTVQFSQGSFLRSSFEEIGAFISQILADGKTRYTSITNEDLPLLKRYYEQYGNSLFSHEVVFNFEIRANQAEGIIPYAEKIGIQTVVYQPLRRNRTAERNWPLLVNLAEKYDKTQNQIILNWITSKGYLPLIKSENKKNIDENLASLKFKMEAEDLKQMDDFSPPGYVYPKIDWEGNGNGVRIDQIPNIFDEIYPAK